MKKPRSTKPHKGHLKKAGLTDKGEIAIGKDADLVVLSPELEVLQTYVNGVEIFGG